MTQGQVGTWLVAGCHKLWVIGKEVIHPVLLCSKLVEHPEIKSGVDLGFLLTDSGDVYRSRLLHDPGNSGLPHASLDFLLRDSAKDLGFKLPGKVFR